MYFVWFRYSTFTEPDSMTKILSAAGEGYTQSGDYKRGWDNGVFEELPPERIACDRQKAMTHICLLLVYYDTISARFKHAQQM
eukprot:768293-Hanusia_phi.AAC.4